MSDEILPGLGPMERAPRPRAPRSGGNPRKSQNPPGRSPYEPTEAHRRMVGTLRGAGVGIDTIAQLLNVAKSTIEKHFRQELLTGKDIVVARVSARVVQKALAGDNTCMQFYLRCHGGEQWRDKQRHEHGGIDGAPLAPPNLVMGFLQPLQPATDDEQPAH